jgi:hypothetical protein
MLLKRGMLYIPFGESDIADSWELYYTDGVSSIGLQITSIDPMRGGSYLPLHEKVGKDSMY